MPKPGGRKMSIRMKDAPVAQESVFKKVMNRIRRISGTFSCFYLNRKNSQTAKMSRKNCKFQTNDRKHSISFQKSRKISKTKSPPAHPTLELQLRPAGRDLLPTVRSKNHINKTPKSKTQNSRSLP